MKGTAGREGLAAFVLACMLASPACTQDDDSAIAASKDAGLESGAEAAALPFCAANQSRCGASCVFLMADPSNCGKCGNACAPFPSGAARCVSGVCADPGCLNGFADCDSDPKNGCETNVGGSLQKSCGICDRACEGTCSSGVCVPTLLSAGLASPYSLVLDGTDLFVADKGKDVALPVPDGRILKVPTGGGAAVVLADKQPLPRGIVVDADNVYYTLYGSKGSAQGAVMKVGRDGTCGAAPTCPVVLAQSRRAPWSIAVDADYVYWTERGTSAASNGDGGAYRVRKDGSAGVETVVSPTGEAVALTLSTQDVYFGANGHVYRAPKAGGLGVEVATANGGLAISGGRLFLGDTSRVSVMDLSAGASVTFLFSQQGATSLGVDGQSLFVYENGQVLESRPDGGCPRAGSCPVKMMGFPAPPEPSPSPFAFDAKSVYAAAPDGRLMRVPR
jgi:hypothetical protein